MQNSYTAVNKKHTKCIHSLPKLRSLPTMSQYVTLMSPCHFLCPADVAPWGPHAAPDSGYGDGRRHHDVRASPGAARPCPARWAEQAAARSPCQPLRWGAHGLERLLRRHGDDQFRHNCVTTTTARLITKFNLSLLKDVNSRRISWWIIVEIHLVFT